MAGALWTGRADQDLQLGVLKHIIRVLRALDQKVCLACFLKSIPYIKSDGVMVFGVGCQPWRIPAVGAAGLQAGFEEVFASTFSMVPGLNIECHDFGAGRPASRAWPVMSNPDVTVYAGLVLRYQKALCRVLQGFCKVRRCIVPKYIVREVPVDPFVQVSVNPNFNGRRGKAGAIVKRGWADGVRDIKSGHGGR